MTPKSIKGVAAVTKEFSGVAGEARVASEFVRYGFRVAKPYWNDDEIDLILIDNAADRILTIPIQVKSVQFSPDKKTKNVPDKKAIQGLRKKYVERNLALCVAIYRPDSDSIWFINGRNNITEVYDAQASWNNKHTAYDSLGDDDDVRIYVPHKNDDALQADWLLPPHDPVRLRKRISDIKKEMTDHWTEVMKLESLWA